MKKVSIIIPNFNGEELLKKCIPFVINSIKFAKKTEDIEIDLIVVDDASSDNSKEVIKHFQKENSFIRLVINRKNLGFAKSVHTGIEKSEADYIILLNSDVIIPENFIEKILQPFSLKDKIFAISPLIVDNNLRILSGSYKVPFLKRGEIKFKKWKHLNFKKEKLLKTLFCEGGSVAFNKEIYFQINGFDEIYEPFYYEDTDLCVKAWKKGWKSYFLTELQVIHDHKSTISKFYSKKFIKNIMRRNRFIFLWSNLPKNYLLKIHIPFIIQRLLFNSLKLDFSYLSGLIMATRYLKKIKEKREDEGTDKFFEIIDEIFADYQKIKKL